MNNSKYILLVMFLSLFIFACGPSKYERLENKFYKLKREHTVLKKEYTVLEEKTKEDVQKLDGCENQKDKFISYSGHLNDKLNNCKNEIDHLQFIKKKDEILESILKTLDESNRVQEYYSMSTTEELIELLNKLRRTLHDYKNKREVINGYSSQRLEAYNNKIISINEFIYLDRKSLKNKILLLELHIMEIQYALLLKSRTVSNYQELLNTIYEKSDIEVNDIK